MACDPSPSDRSRASVRCAAGRVNGGSRSLALGAGIGKPRTRGHARASPTIPTPACVHANAAMPQLMLGSVSQPESTQDHRAVTAPLLLPFPSSLIFSRSLVRACIYVYIQVFLPLPLPVVSFLGSALEVTATRWDFCRILPSLHLKILLVPSEMAPCCDGRDDDWYQYGLDDFPPLCSAPPPPLALLRSVHRLLGLISWRTVARSVFVISSGEFNRRNSISSLAVSAEDYLLPIAAAPPPGHLSRSDGGGLIQGSCHGEIDAAADCPPSALMNLRSVCTLYFRSSNHGLHGVPLESCSRIVV